MAITSRLLGSVGAGEVTESFITFNGVSRGTDQIETDWDVPYGDYLFVWAGTTGAVGYNSEVYINQFATPLSASSGIEAGNVHLLREITKITARGAGTKRWASDIPCAFVRVA